MKCNLFKFLISLQILIAPFELSASSDPKCFTALTATSHPFSIKPVDLPFKERWSISKWRSLYYIPNTNEIVRVYQEVLENLPPGGIYAGVAHSQNYELFAYSRANTLFIFDRDPVVIAAHRILIRAFQRSISQEMFKSLFEKYNEEFGQDLKRQLGWSYRLIYRGAFDALSRYFKYSPILDPSSQGIEFYQRLHETAQAGRFFIVNEKLEGKAFTQLRKYAETRNETVKVLYLSNTLESQYTPQLNHRQLSMLIHKIPFHEDGLLLTSWRDPLELHRYKFATLDSGNFVDNSYFIGATAGWIYWSYLALPFKIIN